MIWRMIEPIEDSYPTRPTLLERLKDTGDRESWQQFNDIYGRLIRGFALKAGLTETEADEVVQETLIAAARNLPEYRYDPAVCSFKTWLLNLSQWRVTDQFRKRLPTASARPAVSDSTRTATIDRVPDPGGSPLEKLWDEEWRTKLLEAACERVKREVDARQWQIFDLYALKGWAARDVARALGVNLGRVYLAKHRLGGLLKREYWRLQNASL